MARRKKRSSLPMRYLSTAAMALLLGGTAVAYYNHDVEGQDYASIREYEKNREINRIRYEIEQARAELEADRRETDRRRAQARNPQVAERMHLDFEHRREDFERWREQMEHQRAAIESRP